MQYEKFIKKTTAMEDKSQKTKTFLTKVNKALKKICTTLECVEQEFTTHYKD